MLEDALEGGVQLEIMNRISASEMLKVGYVECSLRSQLLMCRCQRLK